MDGTVGALAQERAPVNEPKLEAGALTACYDEYYPRVYTYMRYRVNGAARPMT